MYGSQFSYYGAATLAGECAAISSAEYGSSLFGLNWFGYEPQNSFYGLAYFGLNCYGAGEPVPPSSAQFLPGWLIWGRIGDVGKPDILGANGIWQRRHTKTGVRSIKMKFYTPTNPRTELQQANRQKFADAAAAWNSLTEPQKTVYRNRAKRLSLYGWNLFVREYYSLNP